MAKSKMTFEKRAREKDREQKRKFKLQRRSERKEEKDNSPLNAAIDEDPDLAGIVPGPQPIADDF